MSASGQSRVDAEQVARHLGQQVGMLSFELAARDVALEAAERRITEVEEENRTLRERAGVQAEPPAPPEPPAGPPPPIGDDLPTTTITAPPSGKSSSR